jgi:ribonucleoside-diphosphate reductase alpha chain
MAARIAQCLRDAAYASSVALAREKGPFPLFSADAFLADGTCASRLPENLKADIRRHGLRNSHLLCIAPTGGLSLALADNTSSGIEPAFGWVVRHTLPRLHAHATRVENHALRVFRALGGNTAQLPPSFITAQHISPQDHIAMVAAVQPFVDAGISKTVHLSEQLPWERLATLYTNAWRLGLKGLTCWRPGATSSGVLQIEPMA